MGVGTRWTEYCVVGFLVSVGEVKLSTKVFFPFGFSFGKERVGSYEELRYMYRGKWLRYPSGWSMRLCPSQIASFLPKTSFPVATYHLKLTGRDRGLAKVQA